VRGRGRRPSDVRNYKWSKAGEDQGAVGIEAQRQSTFISKSNQDKHKEFEPATI
jgi:hypothetical protein